MESNVVEEKWKPVVGFEGLYEVSSLGRVRSLDKIVPTGIRNNKTCIKKGKILKPLKDKGYLRVCLHPGPKYLFIHRIVASAFLPNPEGLPMINHKDEDKTNNIIENLEWCDNSYNQLYGSARERSAATRIKNGTYQNENCKRPVVKIDKNTNKPIKIYESVLKAAEENGTFSAAIIGVAKHRPHCFTAAGFKWSYL